ncbi:TonB-dependent receptor plug domain-containing protein [Mucilaginibacter sp. P19]|uniref:TonB-dependent receptor plug domain-containing protein n=1 Tax=Mucilaginibacter sp. P19 TaxID=3423947 RepID=UPI003D669D55
MDLLTSNTAIKYQLGEDNTVIIYLNGAQFNAFVVKGKVTDDNSQPLPGVSVRLKGTSTGTQTDLNGNYSLNVPDGSVYLVFTYTGFEAQEVNVDSRAVIDIKLKAKDNSLSEVVVVGYGVQRKSDLTGAVTSIKSADLTKIGGSNAAEALQGKIPGVQILSQGGPGAAPTVLIRGLGTNGDPTPLYVVDGMMVTNISFLAPNDIASMEILKDASATAIYGSRGANGVILVTTKKGNQANQLSIF